MLVDVYVNVYNFRFLLPFVIRLICEKKLRSFLHLQFSHGKCARENSQSYIALKWCNEIIPREVQDRILRWRLAELESGCRSSRNEREDRAEKSAMEGIGGSIERFDRGARDKADDNEINIPR